MLLCYFYLLTNKNLYFLKGKSQAYKYLLNNHRQNDCTFYFTNLNDNHVNNKPIIV